MNHANKQDTKVAIITGAARRIGAAIAKYLHASGFNVVIHYNNSKADALALMQSLNLKRQDSAIILQANLCVNNDIIKLIEDTIKWGKRLDLLVNNASIFIKNEPNEFTDKTYNLLFNTNVLAPFYLSQTAYQYLALNQGAIINITDIHAAKPLKDYALYCQSKAALNMQTLSLAKEFAPFVRVNAVAPGAIAWPEGENELSIELQNKIIESTPLKRHGDPIYIAKAVLALAENPFITGQILNVDGGRSLT